MKTAKLYYLLRLQYTFSSPCMHVSFLRECLKLFCDELLDLCVANVQKLFGDTNVAFRSYQGLY